MTSCNTSSGSANNDYYLQKKNENKTMEREEKTVEKRNKQTNSRKKISN